MGEDGDDHLLSAIPEAAVYRQLSSSASSQLWWSMGPSNPQDDDN